MSGTLSQGTGLPGLPPCEPVPGFAEHGIVAFTTTRQAGSYNLASPEPSAAVFGRWMGLVEALAPHASRLATAFQVHGNRILEHGRNWHGWLRDTAGADGHFSDIRATAMAVTLADCVPVFIAHPGGAVLLLHSGWKGTAAGIVRRGLDVLTARNLNVAAATVHLGPSICGECYEVGPEVFTAVTGEPADGRRRLDLRAVIAEQARQAGATVTVSPSCTRCHNDRFFSHRAGDDGRQLAVIALPR